MRAFNWRPIHKGSLTGSFDLELPSGMVLIGCTLFEKDSGKRWIAGPSKKIGDRYQKCVEFTTRECSDRFAAAAFTALDELLGETA